MRILVPIEGSEASLQAVRAAIRLAGRDDEIHLVNVRAPMPSTISGLVRRADLDGFHEDRALDCLGEAIGLLEATSLPYRSAVVVGRGAGVIADYAADNRCGHIVMDVGGKGIFTDYFLRKTAVKVLDTARVPVTLVK